jgi:hypothetical protein
VQEHRLPATPPLRHIREAHQQRGSGEAGRQRRQMAARRNGRLELESVLSTPLEAQRREHSGLHVMPLWCCAGWGKPPN